MEKEIKEVFSNPRVLYSAALFCLVLLLGACADLYKAIGHNKDRIDFSNVEIDFSYLENQEGHRDYNSSNETKIEVINK